MDEHQADPMILWLGIVAYLFVAGGVTRTLAGHWAMQRDPEGRSYGDPGFRPMWGWCTCCGLVAGLCWPVVLGHHAVSRVPWPEWPFQTSGERLARRRRREKELAKAEREAGL